MTRPAAILAMFGAVAIFGANFSVSRYGTLAGLTPYDLVALRFGVGGLILLPFFLRLGARTCAGVGWTRGLVLLATGGFLMTLAMIMGLSFSPAAHGAALAPGTATTVAVVFSLVLARRGPTPLAAGGLALIATGLALVAFAGSTGGSRSVLIGDALFVLSGLGGASTPSCSRGGVSSRCGAPPSLRCCPWCTFPSTRWRPIRACSM
jgi:drug/metabolite transporter (DMT)-like permease